MICDGCKREVTRATVVFADGGTKQLCASCRPRPLVYPLGIVTNKSGYTVSPAYYDNITSRRSVYESDGRHVEQHHKARTHFVMSHV